MVRESVESVITTTRRIQGVMISVTDQKLTDELDEQSELENEITNRCSNFTD